MTSDDPFDLGYDDDFPGSMQAPAGGTPANGMAPPMPGYVDGLNQAQRDAVTETEGPVLVLAGAGTGKTRALTTRLAYLLDSNRAWPSQVLAVTFTNKAAREMKERTEGLIHRPVEGMWLGTFHALCVRMLRRDATRIAAPEHWNIRNDQGDLVHLDSGFTILDTDDQIRLVKQMLKAANLDEKRWPAKQFVAQVSRLKDKAIGPDEMKASDGEFANGRLQEFYRAYQARLLQLNACDFGDLILHCITLLKQHGDVLEKYHRQFRYLLVDEYQDTNMAQYMWLRLLAQGHGNMCCVGDEDQSIYGWRGAEVGNILRFEKDFPDAKVIRLEQNYRSTGHILRAAGGVIAHNEERLGKELWTEAPDGEKVSVTGYWDGDEEARDIGTEIENLQSKGQNLNDIAILVRAGFQTRSFEERFITIGMPYKVVGGLRFYERKEIRDALAYLRVIAQPSDDLALERIINLPKRKIGDKAVASLYRHARHNGLSLYRSADQLEQVEDLSKVAKKPLRQLLDLFETWRKDMQDGGDHVELVERVLEDSGYVQMWKQSKDADAPGRVENLKELVLAVEQFDSLPGFLEHVSLVMDTENLNSAEQITIMTLHGAKGLEFDTVFLPGWEDGLFPHQRALDESGLSGLEEERRLAYVGITRARKKAFVSFAANRRVHGQWQSSIPSRFLAEMPTEAVEENSQSAPGMARGQSLFGGSTYGNDDILDDIPFDQNDSRGSRPNYGNRQSRYHQVKSRNPNYGVDKDALAKRQMKQISDFGGGETGESSSFKPGDHVEHGKFGSGIVIAADGQKLNIAFEGYGAKHVMAGFVKRA